MLISLLISGTLAPLIREWGEPSFWVVNNSSIFTCSSFHKRNLKVFILHICTLVDLFFLLFVAHIMPYLSVLLLSVHLCLKKTVKVAKDLLLKLFEIFRPWFSLVLTFGVERFLAFCLTYSIPRPFPMRALLQWYKYPCCDTIVRTMKSFTIISAYLLCNLSKYWYCTILSSKYNSYLSILEKLLL